MKFGSLTKNWYSLFDRCVDDWERRTLQVLMSQLNLLMKTFQNPFGCLWKQPKTYVYYNEKLISQMLTLMSPFFLCLNCNLWQILIPK
jgi:hypothetical protein